MFSNLSDREKYMLLFLFLLVICLMYYFFVYQPLQKEINNKLEQGKQMKSQIDNYFSILQETPELKEKYKELQQYENVVINQEYEYTAGEVFEEIEGISNDSNLDILSFTPYQRNDNTLIDIKIRGDHTNIYKYLQELRVLKNQVDYEKITFQQTDSEQILEVNQTLLLTQFQIN